MEVKYIDHMGDDLRVVNSARVSFNKESDWEFFDIKESGVPVETKFKLSEKDQKLIKYLATHNHWTPFSHVVITMREKVPIFVARQRFKHCIGFTYEEEGDGLEGSYNEVSRRYVDDAPEFFVPDTWRKAAENVKQGSSDEEIKTIFSEEHVVWDDPTSPLMELSIKDTYEGILMWAKSFYLDMVDAGVAPEQARMVLPQSMYTEYYVTGSLAAWARAYKLRSDPHAQKEIQDLAKMWNDTIGNINELKYSWEALTSGTKEA